MARKRLRAPAAAEYAQLSLWRLKQLTRAGLIPHYKIGAIYEFDPDELDRWLQERHVPAREPAAS